MNEGTSLECGCCGDYFETWKDYIDQDQDTGCGICSECQEEAGVRNEFEWKKQERLVADSLSKGNSEQFMAMDEGVRRGLILKMIEDGVLKWTINGR